MADSTVSQADEADLTPTAVALRDRALRLLDEIGEEGCKAFAVASAGRTFVGESAITERHLFEVIEDVLSDAMLQNELRKTITELAAVAGEARHG